MRTVRILLLVGSNGKQSACVEGDLGWGDLADNIMSWDGSAASDPEASSRFVVTVSVPEPAIVEIAGHAEPVAP